MKLSTLSLSLSLSLFTSPSHAATWYFLTFWSPSGQSFTELSGDLIAPSLPTAGVYYLWPGLQPTDNSGVYQNVLDGRSGTWWLGSGWCCSSPSLPWGGGFNVPNGGRASFSNVRQSDGSWTSTTSGDGSATDNFALGEKSFNQALFAIELTDVSWDFGPLAFENVVIKSTGSDASWCNESPANYNSATVYSISGLQASVDGDTVTCTIASLVLERPA